MISVCGKTHTGMGNKEWECQRPSGHPGQCHTVPEPGDTFYTDGRETCLAENLTDMGTSRWRCMRPRHHGGSCAPTSLQSDQGTPQRLSVPAYMMSLAQTSAVRSTCVRRQVGAVVTESNKVMGTGYVGSIPGTPHCSDVGCLMVNQGERARCIRGVHAEVNAVLQASGRGDVLYATDMPCVNCYKVIANAGINHVYYWRYYDDDQRDMLVEANRRHLASTGVYVDLVLLLPIDSLISAEELKFLEEHWNVLSRFNHG